MRIIPLHRLFVLCVSTADVVHAQTSLTSFVNLFIGTASGANGGSGGNAFPGAAVPHAMVKVCTTTTIDSRKCRTLSHF